MACGTMGRRRPGRRMRVDIRVDSAGFPVVVRDRSGRGVAAAGFRPHWFPMVFGLTFAVMMLSTLTAGGLAAGRFPAVLAVPAMLAAVFALGTARRHSRERRAIASPEDDLKTQYALGEISREQFQDGLVEILKDRYVRGIIGLEEYERRVGRVFSLSAL